MDLLLYRYRHLTVLVIAILAQLGMLAYQVRNDSDIRLIRVWAVTAVTPLARVLEAVRGGSSSFVSDYFLLLGVREDNARLKADLGKMLLENQQIRAELETAQRAEALALFQKSTPMKYIGARLFMNSTGSSSSVYVDRGSLQGVRKGMAVITPNGIAGKVTAVYPAMSLVMLVTDPLFAAGVVSQKNRVVGTLRGQDDSAIVDFVQNEKNVEQGEWFYTSGSDYIFPRGLRVGVVTQVENGTRRKQIRIHPAALDSGLEEVLIVLEGVHTQIPDLPAPEDQQLSLQLPPPSEPEVQAAQTGPAATDADRVVEQYRNSVPNAVAPASAQQ